MWCSARHRASPPTSTSRPSTAPTASSSAARRPSDQSGFSVASAGDVNGDGFADLIVGAPYADPHGNIPARAMWCSARPRALPPISISPRSTAPTASSSAARRRTTTAARSVASAGDVNGDGFADLIVGADGADPHGSYSGASYVVFGKARASAPTSTSPRLDGANGFKLSGVAATTQRPLGRLGRRRQRRRLRRPDRRRPRVPTRTATPPARAMWCSARPRALPPISTSPPSTAPTASSSAARRQTTRAASRCPRPATSTATASPT